MTPALAVLLTVLAMLMLPGPMASAGTGRAHHAQASVDVAGQPSADTVTTSHQPRALPPVHRHHMRPAVLRHRGGGRPLPGASGRAASFLKTPDAGKLHPRWARATEAVSGRLTTTYPMRT